MTPPSGDEPIPPAPPAPLPPPPPLSVPPRPPVDLTPHPPTEHPVSAPSAPPPDWPVPSTDRGSRWFGKTVQLVMVASVIAVIVGGVSGVAVFSVTLASNGRDEMFAELGAFIFGALAAIVMGVVAYLATVLVLASRWLPRGSRMKAGAVAIAGPIVLVFAAGAATEGVSGFQERDQRRDVIESLGATGGLALVDGTTLDRPIEGWHLDGISGYGQTVLVRWDVADRTEVSLSINDSFSVCENCAVVATTPSGAAVRSDGSVAVTTIAGTPYRIDVYDQSVHAEAIALLQRLQPVSAEEFRQACGRRC